MFTLFDKLFRLGTPQKIISYICSSTGIQYMLRSAVFSESWFFLRACQRPESVYARASPSFPVLSFRLVT